MSLLIGRITLEDPDTWPEPMGEAVQRVGGVPTPGPRAGLSFSPSLTLAPADTGAKADRQRVRRQIRALLNNPAARLQGVWVAWGEDAEQDGWYVPAQGAVDLEQGALASAFFRMSGVGLELVGRPRTHRRAVLARIRDLRLSTEPKDTLSRLYGLAFDGSGSVGSDVTPAPLVWLPSDGTDVVAHTGGSPAIPGTRIGRSSTSVPVVTGLTDLAVVSFEQAAAARLRGDVILYDRRADTGTPTNTTGPDPEWEEVHGRDWPWSGAWALDNYLCRISDTGSGIWRWERWDGSDYVLVDAIRVQAFASATYHILDTVESIGVHEWTPERAVVRVIARDASVAGTRCTIFITLQRGWTGPRVEAYGATGQNVRVYSFGGETKANNTIPSTFTGSVNYGKVEHTSAGDAILTAVVQHAATTLVTGTNLIVTGSGYVSAHLGRSAVADGATEAAALGADVLAGTLYPQTIVPR